MKHKEIVRLINSNSNQNEGKNEKKDTKRVIAKKGR